MSNTHTYPKESAGRLLSSRVPVVSPMSTIGDAEKLLLKSAKAFDSINYIYAVTSSGKLSGVLSIKELFSASKDTRISSLITREVVSSRAYTDQEKVARLALHHNLKAIPIVDAEGVFLGVMQMDDILRVLDKEAEEDLARRQGIIHTGAYDSILSLSVFGVLSRRLPWLVFGLFGGMIMAGIIHSFEEVLSQYIILAAFIPLIVYLADAMGAQMSAFIIRDFAVSEPFSFVRYFIKQAGVVLGIGVVLSALLFGVSMYWYQDIAISSVLAIALFITSISTLVSGLLVPYLFYRLSLDPANASGPVATIIQDTMSIVILLTTAVLLLG